MLFDNNKISLRQMQILIIANNLALGLIILPELFSGGLIINNLALLFFLVLIIMLISSSIKKNPDSDQDLFYNIISCQDKNLGLNKNLDKNLALDPDKNKSLYKNNFGLKILFWPLLIKIIFNTGLELKLFADITKSYILPDTSKFITSAILILISLYLVFKGYETRARLCEILIWPIILPIIIIFISSLFNINLSGPDLESYANKILLNNNINKLAPKKIFSAIFIFSELDYLYLANIFIKNKDYKPKQKKILQAVFFTWLIIFFLINIIKLIINSNTSFFIIKSINTIDMPNNFIQNQDFFITSFLIISFFILINSGLFFSNYLAQKLFSLNQNKNLISIIIILALLYFIFITPEKISWLIIYILGSFYYFILPVILLIINSNKKNNNRAGELK